jgi:AcrR family transcriptional regulator
MALSGRVAAGRPKRADARRNYDQLLTAAREVFGEHGTDAALDDVAKRAGVGAGTLYRHFPTRDDLLEAVFRDRVEELTVQAEELLDAESPVDALATWLRAVVVHSTTYRGLAATVMATKLDGGSELTTTCHGAMYAAGAALLDRAVRAGQVRPEVSVSDVLKLVNAIAWATEQANDGSDQIDRLMDVVMTGVRTATPAAATR